MSASTMLHPRHVPSPPSIGLRIAFLLDKIDDCLVTAFGLRECSNDARRSLLEATRNEEQITIDARVFVGTGRLTRLAVARGASTEGGFESLTVVALPRPDLGAPLYVLEAVGIDGIWSSLQLDLAGRAGQASFPELTSLARDLRNAGESSRACTWASQASSIAVSIQGVPREDFTVDHAIAQYLDAFVARLEGAEHTSTADGRCEQRAFLAEMRRAHAQANAFDPILGRVARRFFGQTIFDPSVV